jgi:hypothetical protein
MAETLFHHRKGTADLRAECEVNNPAFAPARANRIARGVKIIRPARQGVGEAITKGGVGAGVCHVAIPDRADFSVGDPCLARRFDDERRAGPAILKKGADELCRIIRIDRRRLAVTRQPRQCREPEECRWPHGEQIAQIRCVIIITSAEAVEEKPLNPAINLFTMSSSGS